MSDTATTDWKPLEQALEQVMTKDRQRLSSRLRGLQQKQRDGKPYDRALAKWHKDCEASLQQHQQRRERLPTPIEYPVLPVTEQKEKIAALIRDHQVVVLAGETGSGKTTQIPKICLELGRGVKGMVGHTQPRRIAANTVANRIAEELKTPLGQLVGYQVRFTDQSSDHTLIKVMTDGILLAEIQNDPFLNRYDTLIIDEAHERSLNIDFLLGYLKQLLPKRPDLKLIITSATIDVERFSKHFDNAPVIEVSGRTYPVDVWYRPAENRDDDDDDSYQPIIDAIDEIERHEREQGKRGGDILVFMSGERDIREAAKRIRKADFRHFEVLPLYARLSLAEQQKVFAPHKGRRVVLATNVAETSITVPGIRYVIDPGYARLSRYSYRTKVQRLPIEPISQASANQRKGRCGRVAEGICIRLYSEDDFLSRPEFTDAEILRTNLAAVILQMLQMRMGSIHDFPFVDPPDRRLINDGYKLLEELQAVDPRGRLTAIGKQLTQLAVDPRLARMLIAANGQECVREVLIIISALSVQDPRERPADKQQHADQMHRRFWHEESDFLSLVNLWDYMEEQRQALSQNQFRKLCKKEFLSYLRWREWRDVHHQLRIAVKALKLKDNPEPASYEKLHRALVTGLLGNLGMNTEDREYLGARNRKFMIFPGSSQFKKTPKWLMAAELLETSRLYAHTVAKIDPQWALHAAEHLVKRNHFEPHYDARTGRVKGYEKVTLYGLTLVEKQSVDFSKIDAAACREVFIRSALVEGRYAKQRSREQVGEFFRHNRRLLEELHDLEAKSRRRDIIVDEQVVYDFYDERLPDDVITRAAFEKWRQQAEADNPELLFIRREQLMRHDAGDVTEVQFPDELTYKGISFPLEYHFEPGHENDGVNLKVPVSLLHQVPEHRLQWLVPGLLRDKCIGLVKSLPKNLRKHFVPVPDVVDKALAAMAPDNTPLTEALGHQLKRHTGIEVPDDAWAEDSLDDFYRINLQVLDESGKVIDSGRALQPLRERYREKVQANIQSAATGIEQQGLTGWDFATLPEKVELKRGGLSIRAYPALIDKGDSVDLEVLDDPREAQYLSRKGITRLLVLESAVTAKYLRKELLKGQELALAVTTMGKRDRVADDLMMAAFAQVCLSGGELPRTREAFDRCLAEGSNRVTAQAQRLADVLATSLKALVGIKKSIKQNKNALALALTVGDINRQLAGLFYAGMVYDTPQDWLEQYPRYLKAIDARLERAQRDPHKDRLGINELTTQRERLEAYLNKEGEHQLWLDPRLMDFRWRLEELRVSLFAQTLKTRMPVSTKRLNKLWQEILDN
ncbi:ATP-dependent RNA helicase HrpA [Marinimicrobium alkaliphilum]|uniref:ATP-dependent RNA helicase HrpA n=1 Tax=Marinimicrobium alkaliphilum TaxID=2202654 RepID=UPI000DB94400|nr:ATP-dependent RNA helicase HrpA [Marinimicrobium alkaliphilum]